MAITVEDGTGKDDANALVDVAFFSSYHTERGRAIPAASGDIEQAIILATDYFEQRWRDRLKGRREFEAQALSFPRVGLRDRDGYKVEGVPIRLKQAISEYALRAVDTTLLPDPTVADSGRPIVETSEKVGPIEETTRYQEGGAQQTLRPYPAADRMLSDYVFPGGRTFR